MRLDDVGIEALAFARKFFLHLRLYIIYFPVVLRNYNSMSA